jgi:hypothetical protein
VDEVGGVVEGGCVARHADGEGGGEGAGVVEGDAALGEVDAVGAGGEGDVDAIVDGDEGERLGGADELEERAAVEVFFADLEEDGVGWAAGDGALDGVAVGGGDGGPVAGGEEVRRDHPMAIGDGDDAQPVVTRAMRGWRQGRGPWHVVGDGHRAVTR